MSSREDISVAMAAYNGEAFIEQQIKSIINQFHENDELIISDNGSTDQTLVIIKKFVSSDSRIKLVHCDVPGVIANFNNAIAHCNNPYIFLADQDDIWVDTKIQTMVDYFERNPQISVIMSDIIVTDNELHTVMPSFYEFRGSRPGVLKNIIKNSYIGCAMAFTKAFRDSYMPIPEDAPMHDMWIGLMADKLHQVLLIPEKLVLYRRHSETVTTVANSSSLVQKIKWRWKIIKDIFFVNNRKVN